MTEEVLKKHYWMVAAKVIFTFVDVTEGVPEEAMQAVQAIDMNAVVLGDTTDFPVSMIARTHQAVQMQFNNKMGDAPVAIRDVVITGLMYLGYMAQPDFNNVPAPDAEPKEEAGKPDLKVVQNDPTDPYAE